MLKELLKYSILTSTVAIVGCSSVPKEDNSSVLMEDVIVQRTTTRSTTQNPKPKSTGGVQITGDNISIGTLIVNSPNTSVDHSVKTVAVQQQQTIGAGKREYYKGDELVIQHNGNYHTDRDFFKGMDQVVNKLLPSFMTSNQNNR